MNTKCDDTSLARRLTASDLTTHVPAGRARRAFVQAHGQAPGRGQSWKLACGADDSPIGESTIDKQIRLWARGITSSPRENLTGLTPEWI